MSDNKKLSLREFAGTFGARANQIKLPFDAFHIEDGFNAREKYEDSDIEELMNDIFGVVDGKATRSAENGLMYPISGHWDKDLQKFVVTDAHRRYFAIKMGKELGFEVGNIPCQTLSSDPLERAIIVITSNSQKKLEPIERAAQFAKIKALMETETKGKVTLQMLADKLHTNVVEVKNMLELNELPEDVKDKIRNKELAYMTALDEFRALVREAKGKGKSKEEAKEEAKENVTGNGVGGGETPDDEETEKDNTKTTKTTNAVSASLMERMNNAITLIKDNKSELEGVKKEIAEKLQKFIVLLKNGATAEEAVNAVL